VAPAVGRADAPARPGAGRVLVPVLLILATLIAYADRQVIALLKPALDRILGWSAADYGTISASFQLAVAVGFLGAGWLVDRLGPRLSLGLGMAGWSLCAVLHALARSVPQFIVLRAGLGLFESVGTPAMMAAVSARFRPDERSRIVGILNAAPNLAAMLTPLLVSLIFPALGWRGTVAAIGATGFLCAAAWMLGPIPGRVPPAPKPDAAHLPDRTEKKSQGMLRRTAAFALCKLLCDPVWWFMLFWLPDLLHRRFGLGVTGLGLPIAAIYGCAGIGALLGGYLPHRLGRLSRGTAGGERGRRLVMGVAAACVLPIPLVLFTHSLTAAVALVGLALAAHQVFASCLFGFIAEQVPGSHVGRAASAGAFCGNLGGALMLHIVGGVIASGGLLSVFFYCAAAYLVAWCLFAMLAPLRLLTDGPR